MFYYVTQKANYVSQQYWLENEVKILFEEKRDEEL
jgi:hypothetical protein